MEPRRAPLPTAGHPLPHAGTLENNGPVISHAPARRPIACFGAPLVKFDAETFEMFPEKLLRYLSKGKKRGIALDNLDNTHYRHAKRLVPLLHRYRMQLRLPLCLPAAHNWLRIERARKLRKRLATHNR